MKKIMFSLAFMLIGLFAFANSQNQLKKIDYKEATELIASLDTYSTDYSIIFKDTNFNSDNKTKVVDCLLKITFQFEDGTSQTIYVLVEGKSCKEILG